MNLQEAFAQLIIPIKEKLSEEDYKNLLVAAEDFGHKLLRANILAHIINLGVNVHFWWQEFDQNQCGIFWEADYRDTEQHIQCDPKGYSTAEEAMKGLIQAFVELLKQEEAKKIIRKAN